MEEKRMESAAGKSVSKHASNIIFEFNTVEYSQERKTKPFTDIFPKFVDFIKTVKKLLSDDIKIEQVIDLADQFVKTLNLYASNFPKRDLKLVLLNNLNLFKSLYEACNTIFLNEATSDKYYRLLCNIIRHYLDIEIKLCTQHGKESATDVVNRMCFILNNYLPKENTDLYKLEVITKLDAISHPIHYKDVLIVFFESNFNPTAREEPIELDACIFLQYLLVYRTWHKTLNTSNIQQKKDMITNVETFMKLRKGDVNIVRRKLSVKDNSVKSFFSANISKIKEALVEIENENLKTLSVDDEDSDGELQNALVIKQEDQSSSSVSVMDQEPSIFVDLTEDDDETGAENLDSLEANLEYLVKALDKGLAINSRPRYSLQILDTGEVIDVPNDDDLPEKETPLATNVVPKPILQVDLSSPAAQNEEITNRSEEVIEEQTTAVSQITLEDDASENRSIESPPLTLSVSKPIHTYSKFNKLQDEITVPAPPPDKVVFRAFNTKSHILNDRREGEEENDLFKDMETSSVASEVTVTSAAESVNIETSSVNIELESTEQNADTERSISPNNEDDMPEMEVEVASSTEHEAAESLLHLSNSRPTTVSLHSAQSTGQPNKPLSNEKINPTINSHLESNPISIITVNNDNYSLNKDQVVVLDFSPKLSEKVGTLSNDTNISSFEESKLKTDNEVVSQETNLIGTNNNNNSNSNSKRTDTIQIINDIETINASPKQPSEAIMKSPPCTIKVLSAIDLCKDTRTIPIERTMSRIILEDDDMSPHSSDGGRATADIAHKKRILTEFNQETSEFAEGQTILPFKKRRKMSLYSDFPFKNEIVEVVDDENTAQPQPTTVPNPTSVINTAPTNPTSIVSSPFYMRTHNMDNNTSYPATPMISIATIAHLIPPQMQHESTPRLSNNILLNNQFNYQNNRNQTNVTTNLVNNFNNSSNIISNDNIVHYETTPIPNIFSYPQNPLPSSSTLMTPSDYLQYQQQHHLQTQQARQVIQQHHQQQAQQVIQQQQQVLQQQQAQQQLTIQQQQQQVIQQQHVIQQQQQYLHQQEQQVIQQQTQPPISIPFSQKYGPFECGFDPSNYSLTPENINNYMENMRLKQQQQQHAITTQNSMPSTSHGFSDSWHNMVPYFKKVQQSQPLSDSEESDDSEEIVPRKSSGNSPRKASNSSGSARVTRSSNKKESDQKSKSSKRRKSSAAGRK